MSDINALIDRYIDAWNATDPGQRRDLIARTWTETASYRDPMLEADGQDSIDRMIVAVQQRFPGHRFSRTGEVESHHEHARFRWTLAPNGGAPVVEGTDVAVLSDGRLHCVIGFFDRVPQPA